jgi:hypothetical protein
MMDVSNILKQMLSSSYTLNFTCYTKKETSVQFENFFCQDSNPVLLVKKQKCHLQGKPVPGLFYFEKY